MAYSKQNFFDGMVLSAEHLNRMDTGIAEAEAEVEKLKSGILNGTDGELVRDFIPALCNGEVGLYDRANGQFYANAGTGAFVAGEAV